MSDTYLKLDLFKIVNIGEIKQNYHIDNSTLIDYCVGYDDNIYLLFSMEPPKRIDGMFVNTNANAFYYAVRIIMDWYNGQQIHTDFYDFGRQKMNYHFIRPLGEYFLLLGARCMYYSENNIEQNGLIIDKNSNIIREMCLGDGIENCITTADMKIITSYFDEGVFGNFGWDEPIGSSGLIVWDCNGNIVWQNTEYDIWDCYAMNTDSKGNLWFYYYGDFNLVCTDFKNDMVLQPDIDGANGFIISESQRNILFSGSYNDNCFYIFNLDYSEINAKRKIDLYCSGNSVQKYSYGFYGSKILALTEGNELFGYEFIDIVR